MTTEHELLHSKLLAERLPLLAEGVGQIADPQVRYRGTIGGDICHGDPANDHPALMLALDASFVLTGPKGERVVKAEDYFVGLYETLAQADEILTQIRIPMPAAGHRLVVLQAQAQDRRLRHRRGGGAAADEGWHRGARVDGADQRRPHAAEVLRGRGLPGRQGARRRARSPRRPAWPPNLRARCGLRGDADYKTAMAGEMARRALQIAQSRARA